jgi:hypothetical protein
MASIGILLFPERSILAFTGSHNCVYRFRPCLLHADSPPVVRCSLYSNYRHGKTGWPIRSHGQECNLQHDTNKTVHHQNHVGTRTPFVDFIKQPHPPPLILAASGVPIMPTATAAIYAALPGRSI